MNILITVAVLIVVAVIVDAVGDAFFVSKTKVKKILGHLLQLCTLTCAGALVYCAAEYNLSIPILIVVYVFTRFGLFSAAYNIAAGEELFYIGGTDIIDISLNFFFEKTSIPPVAVGVMWWLSTLVGLVLIGLL